MRPQAQVGRPDAARRTYRLLETRLADLDAAPDETIRGLLARPLGPAGRAQRSRCGDDWVMRRPRSPRVQGYVEAPNLYTGAGPALFLAGGITGCPDWQARAVHLLRRAGVDWVILNPRRPDHPVAPVADRAAATEQTAWEYRHLRAAQAILFWFPPSASAQPIALYELGACAAGVKPLAVGAAPSYPRRLDVILQLSHARPGLVVRDTLADTVGDLANVCASRRGPHDDRQE